jgi:hypothetical protein
VSTWVALVLAVAASIAQAEPQASDPKAVLTNEESKPLISGDAGVTVTNEYLSRGLVLVNHGAQFQPYGDLFFHVYEGDGFINSVTPTIGFWSNLTTDSGHGASKPGRDLANWYEFDYMPGVAIGFAKHWTLTETYFEFNSPSGGFRVCRSMNTSFAYDDTGLIDKDKNFSLQPHFTWLAELGAAGSAGLQKDGNYFELGLAPNYTILKGSAYPVTFTVPLTLGLGDDKFYNGDTYGYFTTGLTASTKLAFIPDAYGSWTGSIGYKYYNLGDQVAKTDAGNNDQNVIFVSVGCSF